MADDITLPGQGNVVATEESGGKHFQKVAIVDENLAQITPASADDITNKDIMIALKSLILQVANPGYFDKSANQLRVQTTGTSTVTFASNQDIRTLTNLGAFTGDHLQRQANYTSWAMVVRNKIT